MAVLVWQGFVFKVVMLVLLAGSHLTQRYGAAESGYCLSMLTDLSFNEESPW